MAPRARFERAALRLTAVLCAPTAASKSQRNQQKASRHFGWRRAVLYPVHGQLHGHSSRETVKSSSLEVHSQIICGALIKKGNLGKVWPYEDGGSAAIGRLIWPPKKLCAQNAGSLIFQASNARGRRFTSTSAPHHRADDSLVSGLSRDSLFSPFFRPFSPTCPGKLARCRRCRSLGVLLASISTNNQAKHRMIVDGKNPNSLLVSIHDGIEFPVLKNHDFRPLADDWYAIEAETVNSISAPECGRFHTSRLTPPSLALGRKPVVAGEQPFTGSARSAWPAGFVHRFPHFSAHCLIPQTVFLLETGPSCWKRGSMHHFPQFPPLQTTHYHDCQQCRRSFACVCKNPREKIFCLECWEETKQGEAREIDVWRVVRD